MSAKLPSARFRRQLKEQLPILESEGLLSPQQTQSLTGRYRLDALSAEATHFLLMAIYIISSVLIAIGVISFVAAHWRDIPANIKLAAIFGIMLAAHGTGFYLWQIRQSHPRLGHTLVLLGTLIFGANIGLVAQIFHIRGNPFDMFLAWSIGAIAVGYAVRSVPNAAAAVILAGIYAVGNTIDNFRFSSELSWFPLLAIALFVPFIYVSRSKVLLWLTLLLLTITMHGVINDEREWALQGFALSGLLFFSWGTVSQNFESTRFISSTAWAFGVTVASISTYFCSFKLMHHNESGFDSWLQSSSTTTLCWMGMLSVLAVSLWVVSLIRCDRLIRLFGILIAIIFAAVVSLRWFMPAYAIAFTANVLLLLMIVLLFSASFTYEDRRIFWAAVALAILLIVSRTLEYETGLMVKAAVFVACGVGLMVGGVLFERFLKSRRTLHE